MLSEKTMAAIAGVILAASPFYEARANGHGNQSAQALSARDNAFMMASEHLLLAREISQQNGQYVAAWMAVVAFEDALKNSGAPLSAFANPKEYATFKDSLAFQAAAEAARWLCVHPKGSVPQAEYANMMFWYESAFENIGQGQGTVVISPTCPRSTRSPT